MAPNSLEQTPRGLRPGSAIVYRGPGQSQPLRATGRFGEQNARGGSGCRRLNAGGAASLLRNLTQPTPGTPIPDFGELSVSG